MRVTWPYSFRGRRVPDAEDQSQPNFQGVHSFVLAGCNVTTAVQPDLPSFINQRIRWASKWKHNTSPPGYAIMAVLVVLTVPDLDFIVNWFYLLTPAILAGPCSCCH